MKMKIVALVAPFILLTPPRPQRLRLTPQPSDLVDVQSATCAQFAKAMSYAKPGKKPTKKQAAFAVLAQDDLVLAMTWVNGYLTGRDGAKGAHAFNQDWVVSYMGKLSEICKANQVPCSSPKRRQNYEAATSACARGTGSQRWHHRIRQCGRLRQSSRSPPPSHRGRCRP